MSAPADELAQSLPWFESIERIEERFPPKAIERGVQALISDGATEERAISAIEKIVRESASYISFGRFKAVPDQQVKAEIAAIAKAADQLMRAINQASAPAALRLRYSLSPPARGLFGRARNSGNPDPIYKNTAPSPGDLSGLAAALADTFNREIALPADMSAKFDRVRSDLYPLVPLILSAAQFPSRRGRPVNWRVRSLFEACISEWAHAADQPPSAGQTDGQVNSPLLTLLRELVYPTTQDVEVAEALSDAVYLDVLADMKRRRKGLLLSPVIPARRRRGSNVRTCRESGH